MPRLARITGASSGIGKACAERLARDGHDLIAADLATDAGVDAVAGLCASR